MALLNDQLVYSLSDLSGETASLVAAEVNHREFRGQLKPSLGSLAHKLLPLAACFSKAPISGIHVGAIAVGQSGHLYLGANLEFESIPLNATLHAEQSAILNARNHGETEITEIHISESPCGHCRQFMRELSNASELKISIKGNIHSLDNLLPNAFAKTPAQGSGILDANPTRLSPIKPEPDALKMQAVKAASLSFAPYSQCPEGFVMECIDGGSFTGSAVESVAFNPSVPPVLVALNQRNLSSSRDAAITACAQAKLATTLNNSLPIAKAILRSLTDTHVNVVLMECL